MVTAQQNNTTEPRDRTTDWNDAGGSRTTQNDDAALDTDSNFDNQISFPLLSMSPVVGSEQNRFRSEEIPGIPRVVSSMHLLSQVDWLQLQWRTRYG
jgi:hypothetical protein